MSQLGGQEKLLGVEQTLGRNQVLGDNLFLDVKFITIIGTFPEIIQHFEISEPAP